MSTPPKPPERLAEILLEILALSDSAGTKESESENINAQRVEEQSQRENQENIARQRS
jgi:hypothetical protein